jgi:hypothetical protein
MRRFYSKHVALSGFRLPLLLVIPSVIPEDNDRKKIYAKNTSLGGMAWWMCTSDLTGDPS